MTGEPGVAAAGSSLGKSLQRPPATGGGGGTAGREAAKSDHDEEQQLESSDLRWVDLGYFNMDGEETPMLRLGPSPIQPPAEGEDPEVEVELEEREFMVQPDRRFSDMNTLAVLFL